MRHIAKVDIVLENCEYITLDSKYFGELFVDGIYEQIKRIACNSISNMKSAKEVAIEIFKEANDIEYHPFGSSEKTKIFDRLTQYNDITSFTFYYEKENKEDDDDKRKKKNKEVEYDKEDIYINWYGDSDNENESQISYISNQGNLYIVIARDKNVEDFFDVTSIEDVEDMDFHKTMILK